MKKTNNNPITEMEQLAATITEGTKNTLKDILSEAVSNFLREEVLNEDDEETEDDTEEIKDNETSVEETDEISDDADNAEETLEKAEDDTDESETDGDEWSEFDDYKIGNEDGSEQYDFTNETDPETVVKVFKLMKNDDQVSVVKDGEKVCITDNEAGTEYVIELDCETSCNNELNDEITMAESLGYTDNYQSKYPIQGLTMGDTPKNTKDWHKGVPTGTNKPWAGKGKSEPFNKKVEKVFEITLNDGIEDDEMFIDDNEMFDDVYPFNDNFKQVELNGKYNLIDKDGNMTYPDQWSDDFIRENEIDEDDDDVFYEATNVGGFVQQNSTSKSHVPNSNGRKARNMSKGGEKKTGTADPRYSGVNESLENKMLKALKENKQLKETVSKVSKIMKEAVQVNVNLGHIVRLMVENSTTKTEKEDIIKRFNTVKSNDEAKNLYESISSELKKSHSTIVTEQATTAQDSKKINESKIYDEPNGVLDMMKRMGMCK